MHQGDHVGGGGRTLLASDLSAAFEALIALSDARWDLCAMSADDPGRDKCWSVMVVESGRLLQAAVWIASGLLGDERSWAIVRVPRRGSGR